LAVGKSAAHARIEQGKPSWSLNAGGKSNSYISPS
jgi:hypothetical protein